MLNANSKPMPLTGPRVTSAMVVGFLLTVLSTTLFSWWAWGEIKIQPVMAVVVWCGFKLPILPGGLVVIMLGYLGDSLSGGIVGLQVIVNVAVFCVCATAQRQLALNSWPYQMLAVGIMSVVSPLIIMSGLMLTSRQYITPANLLSLLLWQAFLSAFLAPLFFVFLEGATRFLQKFWPASKHGKADGI